MRYLFTLSLKLGFTRNFRRGMLRLSFWVEHSTRGVIFALTGRMRHHVGRRSHIHGRGNIANSFGWSLKDVEMVAGLTGHLVSLHLHHLLVVIVRLAMRSNVGTLSSSHWSNALGSSSLGILIVNE